MTSLAVNGKLGNDSITIDSSVTVPTTLIGDAGNDTLIASSGNTSLNGGAGNDSLVGGSGNDILLGGDGNDTPPGTRQPPALWQCRQRFACQRAATTSSRAAWATHTMTGGAGTDTLDYTDHTAKQGVTVNLDGTGTSGMVGEFDVITPDFEVVNGTPGNDSINGTSGNDVINGLAGNDTLFGAGGDDKLYGGAGNDSLIGGDGNDSLYGGAGNDAMDGGEGDDLLISIGGGTASTLTGGNGNDTFWLDSSTTETVTDASAQETANRAVDRVDALEAPQCRGVQGSEWSGADGPRHQRLSMPGISTSGTTRSSRLPARASATSSKAASATATSWRNLVRMRSRTPISSSSRLPVSVTGPLLCSS